VTAKVMEDFPEPSEGQHIARVREPRGTNIHLVETADHCEVLCRLPAKFQKKVWIARGNYVIIALLSDGDANGKAQGEICHILYTRQITHLKRAGLWPGSFVDGGNAGNEEEEEEKYDEERRKKAEGSGNGLTWNMVDDDMHFSNPNRRDFGNVDDSDSDDE